MTEDILIRLRKYSIPIGFGLLGFILIITGLISYFLNHKTSVAPIHFTADESNRSNSFQEQQLMVDIEGAISPPGVYKMATSTHMRDVLIEAGGLTEAADKSWVEKNINLASKVTDGLKIYIPRLNDQKSLKKTSAI